MRAIIDGVGMTTFSRSAKDSMMRNGMMSGDVVNVLRGGAIRSTERIHDAWRYQSTTTQMTVEFCFRGHDADPARTVPNEVVIVRAWRNER